MDGKAQARTDLERARAALLEDARKSTSAQDHKAARWLIVLSLPLDLPLRRRMLRCGTRSADTNQRYDCDLPVCPVCAERRGARYFKRTMWPALEPVARQQLRWVTIVTHLATDLPDGVAQMAAHHRSLKHIIAKLGMGLRLFGAREVDIYRTSDWPGLSSAKRDLLTTLNWPSDHRGSVFDSTCTWSSTWAAFPSTTWAPPCVCAGRGFVAACHGLKRPAQAGGQSSEPCPLSYKGQNDPRSRGGSARVA